MLSVGDIRAMANRSVARLRAMGIDNLYLFGSFARGEAGASSDLDFLFESRCANSNVFEFSKELDKVFPQCVDAVNIRRMSIDVLASVLPHAVLIFGDKSVTGAFREYCDKESEMGKDKLQDIVRRLNDVLETTIPRIRRLANEKHPRDLARDLRCFDYDDRKIIDSLFNNFARLNDETKGRAIDRWRETLGNKHPEMWADLHQLGLVSRHLTSVVMQGEEMRLEEIANFCEKHLDNLESEIREICAVINKNAKT